MRIPFEQIPAEGLDLELSEAGWFPEQELERLGPVRATVNLAREAGRLDRVRLRGRLEVELRLTCDRCLGSYPHSLAADFQASLEVAPVEDGAAVADHLCSAEAMETIGLAEPVVDVFDLLAQQLFLSLPLKRLCRAECRGFCPRCGADLNAGECGCSRSSGSSPFAVLADLKKC